MKLHENVIFFDLALNNVFCLKIMRKNLFRRNPYA